MNNIQKIRQDLKFTQLELAKALGVSDSAIGMWELGKRSPKLTYCLRLIDLAKSHGKVISLEDILVRGE